MGLGWSAARASPMMDVPPATPAPTLLGRRARITAWRELCDSCPSSLRPLSGGLTIQGRERKARPAAPASGAPVGNISIPDCGEFVKSAGAERGERAPR